MAEMNGESLVIFTRYPEPGKAKTRMIPLLGAEGAADLQRRLTMHTLDRVASCDVPMEVRYEGGDDVQMAACFGEGRRYHAQGPGHLGQRMARAVVEQFRAGADRIVLIGSDCPGLDAHVVRQAFEGLADHDLVLGPATDGGYYLIGVRCVAPGLFDGMDWGSADVLRDTLRIAQTLSLRVRLLDALPDVDRPEDLPVWHAVAGGRVRISVIIPALNEALCIERTLQRIRAAADAQEVEVIVVDGGSSDQTVRIAREQGAQVIVSQRGRAVQMNAGAAAARGDLFVFCHADTLLPEDFYASVQRVLKDHGTAVGAFTLRIDGEGRGLRAIERAVAFRSRRMKRPYGDQALFIRRETFQRLGGYFPMPVMEDFDLVRRARRLGHIVTVDAPATTSARLWRLGGVWRTTLRHQLMIAGYHLGLCPRTLARLRPVRR